MTIALRTPCCRISLGRLAGLAGLLAQSIGDPMARNTAEPGTQLRRLAQAAQLLPCRDKRLLCEVFTLTQASRGAERELTKQRLITRHYLAKGIPVSRQTLDHQINVRGIGSAHDLTRRHIEH